MCFIYKMGVIVNANGCGLGAAHMSQFVCT